MSKTQTKTFEQDAWNLRAGDWLDTAARATAAGAPHLLTALTVGPEDSVLDLCCGPGVIASAAHAVGASAIGVDFAPAMIAAARARAPELEFQIGDAQALGLPADDFTAVVCNFGIQHLPAPDQAMREAMRTLKRGGRFGWTHWLGPDRNPIAKACIDAIEEHSGSAVEDEAFFQDAYRLTNEDAALTMMRRSGFRDVQVAIASLSFSTPRAHVARTALAMLARAPMAFDTLPEEAQSAIQEKIALLLTGDKTENYVRLTAPALVCVGMKPKRPAKRGGFLSVARKAMQSDEDAQKSP